MEAVDGEIPVGLTYTLPLSDLSDIALSDDDDIPEFTSITIQLRGSFFRTVDGFMLFPSKNELQRAFDDGCSTSIDVRSVFTEENFVDLRNCRSPNYLQGIEEYYFSVGSFDQVAFILGLKHGLCIAIQKDGRSVQTRVHFVLPPLDLQTRAVFRQIGQSVSALKEVDGQLRQLGAVPDANGVPVLPDSFVQDEEFDLYVDRALSDASVAELTKYLCTVLKVDRRKLMEKLQPLAARRLELLLELCRVDHVVFPFSFGRCFCKN